MKRRCKHYLLPVIPQPGSKIWISLITSIYPSKSMESGGSIDQIDTNYELHGRMWCDPVYCQPRSIICYSLTISVANVLLRLLFVKWFRLFCETVESKSFEGHYTENCIMGTFLPQIRRWGLEFPSLCFCDIYRRYSDLMFAYSSTFLFLVL